MCEARYLRFLLEKNVCAHVILSITHTCERVRKHTHTHLFVECLYGVLKDHVIFTDDLMVSLTMWSATLFADLQGEVWLTESQLFCPLTCDF